MQTLIYFIYESERWKWHTTEYGDPYSELVLCIYPSKVHTYNSCQPETRTHNCSITSPTL